MSRSIGIRNGQRNIAFGVDAGGIEIAEWAFLIGHAWI